jgi:hypothetical protein
MIVGTNYRAYDVSIASRLNRLAAVAGEFGPNYNRSDGLVKQAFAQIPEAPRTFVHKCHGGFDSLVTSRESFEIATRFFFGNIRARLLLARAEITRATPGFQPQPGDEMRKVNGGWEFDVQGTGFKGTFRIELDNVPEQGRPVSFG